MKPFSKPGPVLLARLLEIKLVAFDFDGVFTNNMVYVDQHGKESVRCSRSDGIGLSNIKEMGIRAVVVSTEVNSVVKHRCNKLSIHCFNGVDNKLDVLRDYVSSLGMGMDSVMFVGNDTNDRSVLENVHVSVVVCDAHPQTCKSAQYVTCNKGGEGAVREICDLLCYVNKREEYEPYV